MADDERLTTTYQWLQTVAEELGVSPELTRDAVGPILDLTANVAHNGPSRPAAPTTAFLVGLALGRDAEAASDEEAKAELGRKIGVVDKLLERYDAS